MNIKPKIKWRVAEIPTGQYRSFERRGWPRATYSDGRPAARIACSDDYVPHLAKEGRHAPLTLLVADHSVTPWHWLKVKGELQTLDEVKNRLITVLRHFPHLSQKAEKETELAETNNETDQS